MNLFASCISTHGPTGAGLGEPSPELQTIVIDGLEYPVISPEATRAALREMLARYGLECNRSVDKNAPGLAFQYQGIPDPSRFVDDFFFGYVVSNRKDVPKKLHKEYQFRRDSILRNNLAVGTHPTRHQTLFTRSTESSELAAREIHHCAFQFPLAMNLSDCHLDPKKPKEQNNIWLSYLLQALSELNGVGSNQTRAYFEMAPVSVIVRLTPRLASGFPLYPFNSEGRANHVLSSIIHGRLPGPEFLLGGEIVRSMKKSVIARLKEAGASVHKSTVPLFDRLSRQLCGRPLPCNEK